jgi:hypothetical protein
MQFWGGGGGTGCKDSLAGGSWVIYVTGRMTGVLFLVGGGDCRRDRVQIATKSHRGKPVGREANRSPAPSGKIYERLQL